MNNWKVDDMAVGDFISVRVTNKHGDHNLDGAVISGVIKEVVPDYDMVRLVSGWCCHTKDMLLEHTPVDE